MKVAILTIADGANYGNRLQNYAMQEYLKSFGLMVDTIRRETSRDLHGKTKVLYLTKELLKLILKKKNTNFGTRKRKRKFDKFNKKYISFSNISVSNNHAPNNLKEEYDYFICGSDQIWNANFEVVCCDLLNHLAFFADDNQRIAFAASFGARKIADGYEEIFRRELPKFKAISTRENSGKDIIKDLINRDVTVVMDPTMLLGVEKWVSVEKKPAYVKGEKYILSYFLGEKNMKIKKYLEDLSSQLDARVISLDIEFLSDGCIKNMKEFLTTPDEFVWLVNHAECIVTDSFHGTVFSILFKKRFVVFERFATENGNDMESRIDSLLTKFKFEKCKDDINNPSLFPIMVDYSGVEEQLEIEKERAKKFIVNSLEL